MRLSDHIHDLSENCPARQLGFSVSACQNECVVFEVINAIICHNMKKAIFSRVILTEPVALLA